VELKLRAIQVVKHETGGKKINSGTQAEQKKPAWMQRQLLAQKARWG